MFSIQNVVNVQYSCENFVKIPLSRENCKFYETNGKF